MRGTPETWAKLAPLKDVMGTIRQDLDASAHRAVRSGVDRARIAIDPGLGFGKRKEQNAEILARLERAGGAGASAGRWARRANRFCRRARNDSDAFLQCATAAAVTAAILGGAHIVRVHDVVAMKPRCWWRIRSSASLALRTIVRPALAHHDPADRRPADRARLAGASVDLVLLLKTAALRRRRRRNRKSTSLSGESRS